MCLPGDGRCLPGTVSEWINRKKRGKIKESLKQANKPSDAGDRKAVSSALNTVYGSIAANIESVTERNESLKQVNRITDAGSKKAVLSALDAVHGSGSAANMSGNRREVFDVIVVGGGFAGMTAAMYLRRAGKRILVLEAETFGGQIVTSSEVENYPGIVSISGTELAQTMENQILTLGAETLSARVTGLQAEEDVFFVKTDGEGDFCTRKVILAVGVKHRKLGIPGEDRLTGRGISWCATCDGNFFRGKTVAVAGGGNTAVQEALELSGICSKVYLIHRRDTLRAEEYLTSRLREAPNIEFLPDRVIREAIGENRLESLLVEHVRTGEQSCLPVDGLFEAVGMLPQNQAFADLIPLDEHGYFACGEDCKTKIPGVFAAGDCRAKSLRQLVSAASDGAMAAMEAIRELSGAFSNGIEGAKTEKAVTRGG